MPLLHALAIACCTLAPSAADTLFIEVGSPRLDGRVYRPHAARVRVYRDSATTPAVEWTNALTLGDSAGRPVMRWLTSTVQRTPDGVRITRELRQTYDAVTLAPLGFHSRSLVDSAEIRLRIDGRRVHGTRRSARDTAAQPVDHQLDRPGFFAGASDLVPAAVGLEQGRVIVAPVWSPAMRQAEYRVFTDLGPVTVDVEGTPVRSHRVEERRRSDGRLLATWYLLDTSPYMVYGEVPRPDGGIDRMTEVELSGTPPR